MPAKSKGQENKKSPKKRIYIRNCRFCNLRFKTTNPKKYYDKENCRKRRWDRRHMLEEMGELLRHSGEVEQAIKNLLERP